MLNHSVFVVLFLISGFTLTQFGVQVPKTMEKLHEDVNDWSLADDVGLLCVLEDISNRLKVKVFSAFFHQIFFYMVICMCNHAIMRIASSDSKVCGSLCRRTCATSKTAWTSWCLRHKHVTSVCGTP